MSFGEGGCLTKLRPRWVWVALHGITAVAELKHGGDSFVGRKTKDVSTASAPWPIFSNRVQPPSSPLILRQTVQILSISPSRTEPTMARTTQFKRDLQAAGYQGETVEFYRAMLDAFDDFTPTYATDEQLKRHPKDALRFCDDVRDRLQLPSLSDELILGGLENARKNRAKIEHYVS